MLRQRLLLEPLLAVLLLFGCDKHADESIAEWRPADHSASWTPAEVPEAEDAPPASLGAALYRARCASCHGETGAGDGPARPPIAPRVDLRASTLSREAAELVITRGRGAFMPAFTGQIPPQGLHAIAQYVVEELRQVEPAQ